MSLEGSFPEGPMLMGPKTDESWGVAGCGAERPFVPQGTGDANRRRFAQKSLEERSLDLVIFSVGISYISKT